MNQSEQVNELFDKHSPAVTVTFAHQVESFAGMRVHGVPGAPLDRATLERVAAQLQDKGVAARIVRLEELCPLDGLAYPEAGTATLLIVPPGGVEGVDGEALLKEMHGARDLIDAHFLHPRRGKVMNKQLRFNGVVTDEAIEADIPNGQGTVMSFETMPQMAKARAAIGALFGEPYTAMNGEINYYYNPAKCGINFHGDAERNIVVGIRMGVPIPLEFQWFHRSKPVGNRWSEVLAPGTLYAFDEKAVGSDWKAPSAMTLRHAAGRPGGAIPTNEKILEQIHKRGTKRPLA